MQMMRGLINLTVAVGLAQPTAVRAEKVELWIRAFIPKDLPGTPGYVVPVPGQSNAWMIPGPGIPYILNGPLPLVGSCYNSNNRTFEAQRIASAKVETAIHWEINGGALESVTVAPPAAVKTIQYNCSTGAVTCEKTVALDKVTVTPASVTGYRIEHDLTADAENACIPLVEWTPSPIVPSIKWQGRISVNPRMATIRYQGSLAEFPAYEAYISVDGGPPVALFQESPAAGATVWSLVKNRTIDKTVAYRTLDGIWQSSDPARRFRLNFIGDSCEWTETSGANQLKRRVPVERLADGAGYRLARANADPALLTFLGFSPAIQSEMLARGPLPSFIELRFDGAKLRGSWNGILVTKDNQGKFQEMKQPGGMPAKPFEFLRI